MSLQKLSKIIAGFLVVSMFVGMAITVVIAGGNYKLIYRMQKGQHLKYMIIQTSDESTEMQGQEQNVMVKGKTLMHLQVQNVDKEGNITFDYTIDSLSTHVKSVQFDTAFMNPEGLIGKRTRQIMNARGKKLKSVVLDTIELTGLFAQMGGARQSSVPLIVLSENELKIGDSWTESSPDTIERPGGKMVLAPVLTYTVTAEVDTLGYKCLRLNYTGTMTIKGEWTQMGMNFFIEGEGPASGTAYFAPKEGLLVARLIDVTLESTVALTGQMSMTLPSTSSTKIAMVLVK
jgi:hypothetical protein